MPKTDLYQTIYADPPWPERGGGKVKRGADRHYPLMTVKAIKSLPVQTLAAPNCHLYLWCTNNFLESGFEVIRAWGFKYITLITWAKTDKNAGLGQYFQGKTEQVIIGTTGGDEEELGPAVEQCLFAVKGNLPYRFDAKGKRARGTTLLEAPRGKHSEKPEAMREVIEEVSHGRYIELFARRRVVGWDAWGFDAENGIPDFGPVAQGALLEG